MEHDFQDYVMEGFPPALSLGSLGEASCSVTETLKLALTAAHGKEVRPSANSREKQHE